MLTATASDSAFWAYTNILMIVLMNLCFYGGLIYLFILLIKALRKYLNSGKANHETLARRKSLGQVLKEHRIHCAMTQEFVAEHLGVSRQAVSKWENGTSDPSTSNLLALARLYGISAEELLKEIRE